MAFTEFYCNASTGSNLNSGSSEGSPITYASGSWVQSTGVFTVASGDPASDGVNVGDFASVYPDAATTAVFIGRVTARDATTITVSLTAKSGSAPADGSSNTTCKIGGPWKGPTTTESFPMNFIDTAMNDGTNLVPRVNMKNNATYDMTDFAATLSSSTICFEGYTTTPGDGGHAILDGGEVGAAFNLLAVTGANLTVNYIHFRHNGGSGGTVSTHGVNVSGARNVFYRCLCSGMRGHGFFISTPALLLECEAWDCNRSNATSKGAITLQSSGAICVRCRAHHNNNGANGNGFDLDGSVALIRCISDGNDGNGLYATADQFLNIISCDFYNNGGHGFSSSGGSGTLNFNVQNCNFVGNGGYGIYCTSTTRYGVILNCGFGAGTQANASGNITASIAPVVISGSITLPDDATPWVDPDNGDFRIVLPNSKGVGVGTYPNYSGLDSAPNTVAYPDVGAAQSKPGTRAY